jgi:hypothetical protein
MEFVDDDEDDDEFDINELKSKFVTGYENEF